MGLIHEKNQRPKFSCYCTFNQPLPKTCAYGNRYNEDGQFAFLTIIFNGKSNKIF